LENPLKISPNHRGELALAVTDVPASAPTDAIGGRPSATLRMRADAKLQIADATRAGRIAGDAGASADHAGTGFRRWGEATDEPPRVEIAAEFSLC